MDFSVLLQDLKDVAEKYKGKSTEPAISTSAYVDMFLKILKRAQKVTEDYEEQIRVLYVVLNQLAAIYQDLTQGNHRDQLCKYIFQLCAKTVLHIQWSHLDEHNAAKTNLIEAVKNVTEILEQHGFSKFKVIQELMDSHWTHPVLSKIMSGEEEDENDEECLEYIRSQDPEVLKLRVDIMIHENCEEFALNLCNWSLRHPAMRTNNLKIKEQQIFILHKQEEYTKMQEVCETIVCHDGIQVMSHLAKNPANQALCIRLAQVFLIHDWVNPNRNCCTQELLKLWIHHQYLADKDEERFLESIWTVAKVCRDTEQIGTLIDGVKKECGDMFIQLYTELCKYAINIDKGNYEKEMAAGNLEEAKRRKLALSKTCVRMSLMLKEHDFRMSRLCGLTAFSLDPTTENLNLVNKLYWTIKHTSAVSRHSKTDIATLYEIDRLLGKMRPESLNPDYSWKQLIPLCKRYKHDCDLERKGIKVEKREVPDVQIEPESTVLQTDGHKQPKGKRKDIQKVHIEKLLSEKRLSQEEIEKLIRERFPRNTDLDDAPALDMKELDKTIESLKKSIYEETLFRESLEKNFSPLRGRQKSPVAASAHNNTVGSSSANPDNHVNANKLLYKQLSEGKSMQHQVLPSTLGTLSHQVPSTSFQMTHQPLSSSANLVGSKTRNLHGVPTNQLHGHSPAILGNNRKIPCATVSSSQVQYSGQSSNSVPKNVQQMKPSGHFNILRPAESSQQECAKIAQQIAEMREKERREKLEQVRNQGKMDAKALSKAVLQGHQGNAISNLLSLTFQGNKSANQNQAASVSQHSQKAVSSSVKHDQISNPKYVLPTEKVITPLQVENRLNLGKGTSVKPVLSMRVPRSLTEEQFKQLMQKVHQMTRKMSPTKSNPSLMSQQAFNEGATVTSAIQSNANERDFLTGLTVNSQGLLETAVASASPDIAMANLDTLATASLTHLEQAQYTRQMKTNLDSSQMEISQMNNQGIVSVITYSQPNQVVFSLPQQSSVMLPPPVVQSIPQPVMQQFVTIPSDSSVSQQQPPAVNQYQVPVQTSVQVPFKFLSGGNVKQVQQNPVLNTPELSPAVVEQLLASLSKRGEQKSTQQPKPSWPKDILPKAAPQQQVNLGYKICTTSPTSQSISKSVADATKKILQLREMYGLNPASNPIATDVNSSPENRGSGSLIQKLMMEDDSCDYKNSKLSSFIAGMPASKSTASDDVPDLPDLGAKEVAAILGLETDGNQAEQNNTIPQSTYLNANRKAKEREKKDEGRKQKCGQTIFKCGQCGKMFPSRELVEEHQTLEHQTLDHQLNCKFCNKTFKNKHTLRGHERKNCRFLKAESSTFTGVKCFTCGKLFESVQKIKDHVKEGCIGSNVKVPLTFNPGQFEFSMLYTCSRCAQVFAKEEFASNHVSSCSAVVPDTVHHEQATVLVLYKCLMCSKLFEDKEKTYRHVSKQCPKLKVTIGQQQVQKAFDEIQMKMLSEQNERKHIYQSASQDDRDLPKHTASTSLVGVNHAQTSDVAIKRKKSASKHNDHKSVEHNSEKNLSLRTYCESDNNVGNSVEHNSERNVSLRTYCESDNHVGSKTFLTSTDKTSKGNNALLESAQKQNFNKAVEDTPLENNHSKPVTLIENRNNLDIDKVTHTNENGAYKATARDTLASENRSNMVKAEVTYVNEKPDDMVKEVSSLDVSRGNMTADEGTNVKKKTDNVELNEGTNKNKPLYEPSVINNIVSESVNHPLNAEESKVKEEIKKAQKLAKQVAVRADHLQEERNHFLDKTDSMQERTELLGNKESLPVNTENLQEKPHSIGKLPHGTLNAGSGYKNDCILEYSESTKEQRLSAEKLYWQEFYAIEKRKEEEKSKALQQAAKERNARSIKQAHVQDSSATCTTEVDMERKYALDRQLHERATVSDNQLELDKKASVNSDLEKLNASKLKNVNQILGNMDRFRQINECQEMQQKKTGAEINKPDQKEQASPVVSFDKKTNLLNQNSTKNSKDSKVIVEKKSQEIIQTKAKVDTRELITNRNKKKQPKCHPSRHLSKAATNERLLRKRGLRSKRQIKQRKFFDEVETVSKGESVKHSTPSRSPRRQELSESEEDIPKGQETSLQTTEQRLYLKRLQFECKLCDYTSPQSRVKVPAYIGTHYIVQHKMGFRLNRHKFECRFCSFNVPDSKMNKIKVHLHEKHRNDVFDAICKGKLANNVDKQTKLSPIKVIDDLNVSMTRSRIKAEKVQRGMRALALRKECADKLRKLAEERKNILHFLENEEANMESDLNSYNITSAHISPPQVSSNKSTPLLSDVSTPYEYSSPITKQLAKRLTRNMVKDMKGSKILTHYSRLTSHADLSESEISFELASYGRSRSASVSSRSSSIHGGKLRSLRNAGPNKSDMSEEIMVTRSGRKIRKLDIDQFSTESSGFRSDDSDSECNRDPEITRSRRSSRRQQSSEQKDSNQESEESGAEISDKPKRKSLKVKQSVEKTILFCLNTSDDSDEEPLPRKTRSSSRKQSDLDTKHTSEMKELSNANLFLGNNHYDSDTESNAAETDNNSSKNNMRTKSNKIHEESEEMDCKSYDIVAKTELSQVNTCVPSNVQNSNRKVIKSIHSIQEEDVLKKYHDIENFRQDVNRCDVLKLTKDPAYISNLSSTAENKREFDTSAASHDSGPVVRLEKTNDQHEAVRQLCDKKGKTDIFKKFNLTKCSINVKRLSKEEIDDQTSKPRAAGYFYEGCDDVMIDNVPTEGNAIPFGEADFIIVQDAPDDVISKLMHDAWLEMESNQGVVNCEEIVLEGRCKAEIDTEENSSDNNVIIVIDDDFDEFQREQHSEQKNAPGLNASDPDDNVSRESTHSNLVEIRDQLIDMTSTSTVKRTIAGEIVKCNHDNESLSRIILECEETTKGKLKHPQEKAETSMTEASEITSENKDIEENVNDSDKSEGKRVQKSGTSTEVLPRVHEECNETDKPTGIFESHNKTGFTYSNREIQLGKESNGNSGKEFEIQTNSSQVGNNFNENTDEILNSQEECLLEVKKSDMKNGIGSEVDVNDPSGEDNVTDIYKAVETKQIYQEENDLLNGKTNLSKMNSSEIIGVQDFESENVRSVCILTDIDGDACKEDANSFQRQDKQIITLTGFIDDSDNKKLTKVIEDSVDQTLSGVIEDGGNQTMTEVIEDSRNQIMAGVIEDSGDQIMTGVIEYSGNQTMTGVTEDIGDQTLTGVIDNIGNQTMTGVIEDTGNQTLTGVVEDSDKQTMTQVKEDSGNEIFTGVIEDSGNQTLTGVIEDSGNQTLTGVLEDSGIQTLTGVIEDSGSQTLSGVIEDSGNQTMIAVIEDSDKRTLTGVIEDSGRQTLSGVIVDSVNQTWTGVLEDSGNQTLTGVLEDSGNQILTGVIEDTGNQTFTGVIEDTGNQTFTGVIEDTGNQTLTLVFEDSGNQTLTGVLEDSGNQTLTGVLEDRGSQTLTGVLEDSGNQTLTGVLEDSGSQTLTGVLEDSGYQTLSGVIEDSGNQTMIAIIEDSDKQTLTGVVEDSGSQTLSGVIVDGVNQTLTGVREDSGNQTLTGVIEDSGNQTLTRVLEDTGSQTLYGVKEDSGNQTMTAVIEDSDNRTLTGVIDYSGSQTLSGVIDDSVNQTLTGVIEDSGNQTMTGVLEDRGSQTLSGVIEESSNQTMTAVIEDSDDQTLTGVIEDSGSPALSGIIEDSGNQTITAVMDDRGNQTITAVIEESGNQTFTGVIDISASQTMTGVIEDSCNQTSTGDKENSSNRTLTGVIEDCGNFKGSNNVSREGVSLESRNITASMHLETEPKESISDIAATHTLGEKEFLQKYKSEDEVETMNVESALKEQEKESYSATVFNIQDESSYCKSESDSEISFISEPCINEQVSEDEILYIKEMNENEQSEKIDEFKEIDLFDGIQTFFKEPGSHKLLGHSEPVTVDALKLENKLVACQLEANEIEEFLGNKALVEEKINYTKMTDTLQHHSSNNLSMPLLMDSSDRESVASRQLESELVKSEDEIDVENGTEHTIKPETYQTDDQGTLYMCDKSSEAIFEQSFVEPTHDITDISVCDELAINIPVKSNAAIMPVDNNMVEHVNNQDMNNEESNEDLSRTPEERTYLIKETSREQLDNLNQEERENMMLEGYSIDAQGQIDRDDTCGLHMDHNLQLMTGHCVNYCNEREEKFVQPNAIDNSVIEKSTSANVELAPKANYDLIVDSPAENTDMSGKTVNNGIKVDKLVSMAGNACLITDISKISDNKNKDVLFYSEKIDTNMLALSNNVDHVVRDLHLTKESEIITEHSKTISCKSRENTLILLEAGTGLIDDDSKFVQSKSENIYAKIIYPDVEIERSSNTEKVHVSCEQENDSHVADSFSQDSVEVTGVISDLVNEIKEDNLPLGDDKSSIDDFNAPIIETVIDQERSCPIEMSSHTDSTTENDRSCIDLPINLMSSDFICNNEVENSYCNPQMAEKSCEGEKDYIETKVRDISVGKTFQHDDSKQPADISIPTICNEESKTVVMSHIENVKVDCTNNMNSIVEEAKESLESAGKTCNMQSAISDIDHINVKRSPRLNKLKRRDYRHPFKKKVIAASTPKVNNDHNYDHKDKGFGKKCQDQHIKESNSFALKTAHLNEQKELPVKIMSSDEVESIRNMCSMKDESPDMTAENVDILNSKSLFENTRLNSKAVVFEYVGNITSGNVSYGSSVNVLKKSEICDLILKLNSTKGKSTENNLKNLTDVNSFTQNTCESSALDNTLSRACEEYKSAPEQSVSILKLSDTNQSQPVSEPYPKSHVKMDRECHENIAVQVGGAMIDCGSKTDGNESDSKKSSNSSTVEDLLPPEIRLENETDEEFLKRAEKIKSALKKAVKSYQSDFDFENQSSVESNIPPVTPEEETDLQNFDVASLYSNTSTNVPKKAPLVSNVVTVVCMTKGNKVKTVTSKNVRAMIPLSVSQSMPKQPVYLQKSQSSDDIHSQVGLLNSAAADPRQSSVSSLAMQLTSHHSKAKRMPVSVPRTEVKYARSLSSETENFKSKYVCNQQRTQQGVPRTNVKCNNSSQPSIMQMVVEQSAQVMTSSNSVQVNNGIPVNAVTGQDSIEKTVVVTENLSKVKSFREIHKDEKPFKWEASPIRELRLKTMSPDKEGTMQVNDSPKSIAAPAVARRKRVKQHEEGEDMPADSKRTRQGKSVVNKNVEANEKSDENGPNILKSTDSDMVMENSQVKSVVNNNVTANKKSDNKDPKIPKSVDSDKVMETRRRSFSELPSNKSAAKAFKDKSSENKPCYETFSPSNKPSDHVHNQLSQLLSNAPPPRKGCIIRSGSGRKHNKSNTPTKKKEKTRTENSYAVDSKTKSGLRCNVDGTQAYDSTQPTINKLELEENQMNQGACQPEINIVTQSIEDSATSLLQVNNLSQCIEDSSENPAENLQNESYSPISDSEESQLDIMAEVKRRVKNKVLNLKRKLYMGNNLANTPEGLAFHDIDEGLDEGVESPAKMCKLDGTSGSPSKSDSEDKHSESSYCSDSSQPSDSVNEISPKPIRQLIHGGRVYQIQQGSVTEFDIKQGQTDPESSFMSRLSPHEVTPVTSPMSSRTSSPSRMYSAVSVSSRHVNTSPSSLQEQPLPSSLQKQPSPGTKHIKPFNAANASSVISPVRRRSSTASSKASKGPKSRPGITTRSKVNEYIETTLQSIRPRGLKPSPTTWKLNKKVKRSIYSLEFKKTQ
ncbi:uncharacterized protein LOC127881244 isoform X2 [Dreissena polymorpha]|uniref:uncharacterized protein LOC127881244 isoform X2 n=1 Tax=Dreissena polymorpha TaxID=45954 RepID=UPI002264B064|nr:uncharacterized protein LOC127881244 isoform X2 [Dreissena polymorpha]